MHVLSGGRVIESNALYSKPSTYKERTAKLLRAASTIVGGDQNLAMRLGIREQLLIKFMSGRYELPRQLLLQTVDILLEERGEAQPPIREFALRQVRERDG